MPSIIEKLILITGASSGIGAATARLMASRGGRVILAARRADELERVAGEVRSAGGEAHVYPVDVGDEQAVEAAAARIKAEVGVPDMIVNNAGAGRWWHVDETPDGEAARIMAAPYFGAFYVTRAFLPEMIQRGTGTIANVTSPAAFVAWPGAAAYTASRWAMRGFSEALRADLRGTGVKVSLIVPAVVMSDYFKNNPGTFERLPRIARTIPTLTNEQVAARIVRAVERGEREAIFPFVLWAYSVLNRIAPGVVASIVAITGYQRAKSA